jgi:hydroxymethylbilane synthase
VKLTLATRRSKLALAQARAYAAELMRAHPGLAIEELQVVTTGDRIQDRPLQDVGGKGLFIKEIEEALLERRADFAVHSIKDVPADLAEGLALAAIPRRADARDVLVTKTGGGLASLAKGAVVGTSSLRRSSQLIARRPDLKIEPMRGNVDTRLRKLESGQVDAIVLARAGLVRMGLDSYASEVLEPEVMLPAVGQGALGIECRDDDARTRALLAVSDDPETRIAVEGERAFMRSVGGSCQLPVAAYCLLERDALWLRAMLAEADGSKARFGERRAERPRDAKQAADVAVRMGRDLGDVLK